MYEYLNERIFSPIKEMFYHLRELLDWFIDASSITKIITIVVIILILYAGSKKKGK